MFTDYAHVDPYDPCTWPETPPPQKVVFSATIYGDPRTKKNSPSIAGTGQRCPACGKFKKQLVRPSKAHDAYFKASLPQITPPDEPIDYRVHCKYIFFMQTHRIVDGLNLQEAIDDLLVSAGVLADDNTRIVVSHDGSRVYYDKENPRVEITITEDTEV